MKLKDHIDPIEQEIRDRLTEVLKRLTALEVEQLLTGFKFKFFDGAEVREFKVAVEEMV